MAIGAFSMQAVSLEQIASVCLSLSELMEAVIEPHSLAMITGATGEVTFTRSGYRVLSERIHHRPLEKFIVQAVTKYHLKTGSDCKLFLILLTEILNGAHNMVTNNNEIEVRRMLSNEINYLLSYLPKLFKNVQDKHAIYTDPSSGVFRAHLKGIVLTSFASKLPLPISEFLTDLLCEFLCNSIADWSHAETDLCYLISNFDSLCSRVSATTSESTTVRGFILNHELSQKDEIVGETKFVIVEDLSRRWDDAIWNVKTESFMDQLGHLWVNTEQWLDSLNQYGVSVIISTGSACDDFLSLSAEKNITVLSRISKEEVDNILYFSKINPVDFVNGTIELCNVGYLKSITPVIGGRFQYTYLETKAVEKSFKPNHILLCCLTDGQWRERYAELVNTLKVVKQWLRTGTSSRINDNLIGCTTMIPKVMDNIMDCFDNKVKGHMYGVCVAFGSFEFFLRTTLRHVDQKISSRYLNFYEILDNALLTVICKCCNTTRYKFDEVSSFPHFQAKLYSRLTFPVEPIFSKEDQIYEVLQLVLQLLKIDAIVCTY